MSLGSDHADLAAAIRVRARCAARVNGLCVCL